MLSHRSALVLLLLVGSSPSMAASPCRPLGPHRGNLRLVSALAFAPSRQGRAFAGFEGGGIARSDDGGRTWQLMSDGITGSTIRSITVHPRLGRLVFAVGERLFRSLDDGRTWTPLPLRGVGSVALDPRHPAVVWAGTSHGLFRSRDTGQTWERIQANLPRTCGVVLLAVDHLDPQRLYIQTHGPSARGFWTSGNGGRSWVRRAVPSQGFGLSADLHAAQTLYLVTSSKVLRSRDAGQTWESFLDIPDLLPHGPMAGDPRDASTFFVSLSDIYGARTLYRTTDAGRHWRPLTRGLPAQLDTLALAAGGDGTELLAGHSEGFVVLRSVDSGDAWNPVASGPSSLGIGAVTATGSGGLLAGITGGVERSLDGGRTWATSLPLSPLTTCLVRDPHDPETIYACTNYPYSPDVPEVGILWKTVDGGDSWIPLPYPFPLGEVVDALDLAVDPVDPQTLYLVTGIGLYRSRDGGQTWESTGEPDIYYESVAVPAGAPGTVLARGPLGISRSTDHGDTWTRVLDPEDGSSVDFADFSPADANVVYAVSGHILFRSDDGGATFASLGRYVRRPLALDPLDPDTVVFAAPGWGQVLVRLTVGKKREVIRADSFGGYFLTLTFDPNDPHRLLAGTNHGGLMEYRFEESPSP